MTFLRAPEEWVNFTKTEGFDIQTSGAPDPNWWIRTNNRGINSFVFSSMFVAGDVNNNNQRNFGYALLKDYRLRTRNFKIGFRIGDTVNTSALDTRLFIGKNSFNTTDNPASRAVYLNVQSASGQQWFNRTNDAGTNSNTQLTGQTSPVNTLWEMECTGSDSYRIYRNGSLVSVITDPNGPLNVSNNDLYVGLAIASDRNALGTRNWGSRISEWSFAELGP